MCVLNLNIPKILLVVDMAIHIQMGNNILKIVCEEPRIFNLEAIKH
jgi:hypothetical protein